MLYTDATSLTPDLIFENPAPRDISDTEHQTRKIHKQLKPEHFYDYHLERNHGYFIYAVNTVQFLTGNNGAVKEWLKTDVNKHFSSAENIVLVADCHPTNIDFMDLVNETLFHSSATVIHFESSDDHVGNFCTMYASSLQKADKIIFVDDSMKSGSTLSKVHYYITNALSHSNAADQDNTKNKGIDAVHFESSDDHVGNFCTMYASSLQKADKIIFVDDSMKSGSTLSKVHYYITNALSHSNAADQDNTKNKGIDAVICLFNKMQKREHEWIQTKLSQGSDNIFAYVNVNTYTSNNFARTDKSQIYEQEKYKKLQGTSVLDGFTNYFKQHEQKISPPSGSDTPTTKRTSRQELFWATHYICSYFLKCNLDDKPTWEDFIEALKINSQVSISNDTLMKVLTQSYFLQYQRIRAWIFPIVVEQFDLELSKLAGSKKGNEQALDLTNLKFYIRRLTLLNASTLLRADVLDKLLVIANKELESSTNLATADAEPGEKGQLALCIEEPSSSEKTGGKQDSTIPLINLEGTKSTQNTPFPMFIAAQIKELIERDNSRSVHLQAYLNHAIKDKYEGMGGEEKKIIRLLYLENAHFLHQYSEFVLEHVSMNERDQWTDRDAACNKIKEAIEDSLSIKNNWRHLGMLVSETASSELDIPNNILTYILLRLHLREAGDNNQQETIKLEKKIKYIFENLSQILKTSASSTNSFLYSRNTEKMIYCSNNFFNSNSAELLDKLYNQSNQGAEKGAEKGAKYADTYSFYVKEQEQKQNQWKRIDAIEEQILDDELSQRISEYAPECGFFLLLYVRESASQKTIALAGFYGDIGSGKTHLLPVLRYFLLLRQSLANFISKHINTPEYFELIAAKREKYLNALVGHGGVSLKELIDELSQQDDGAANEDAVSILKGIQNAQSCIRSHVPRYDISNSSGLLGPAFSDAFFQSSFDKITFSDIKKRYEDLGKVIMQSQTIEMDLRKDDYELTVSPVKTKAKKEDFNYPLIALDLIIYELLVNAKKNRWLNVSPLEEANQQNNKVKNKFTLSFTVQNNQLTVKVGNTGPGLSGDAETTHGQGMKNYQLAAGIPLINQLLNQNSTGNLILSETEEGSIMKIVTASFTLNAITD